MCQDIDMARVDFSFGQWENPKLFGFKHFIYLKKFELNWTRLLKKNRVRAVGGCIGFRFQFLRFQVEAH